VISHIRHFFPRQLVAVHLGALILGHQLAIALKRHPEAISFPRTANQRANGKIARRSWGLLCGFEVLLGRDLVPLLSVYTSP